MVNIKKTIEVIQKKVILDNDYEVDKYFAKNKKMCIRNPWMMKNITSMMQDDGAHHGDDDMNDAHDAQRH